MKKEDYFKELGEVALGSRLKRLSDKMMGDAARIYKFTGHDMRPRWFTLMSLLHSRKQVSVVEAADLLGLTQPCISQFSREMDTEGLLQFTSDPDDLRRKIMSLSKKGIKQYNKMQPVRKAVRQSAIELCTEAEQNFYQALEKFEKAFERKSLYTRSIEKFHE